MKKISKNIVQKNKKKSECFSSKGTLMYLFFLASVINYYFFMTP